MREISLNLLGINEIWLEKKIEEPKMIIVFENLSNEGLTLLKNMLFSIGQSIDQEQVQLVKNLSTDSIFLKSKFKTLFLVSNITNFETSEKIFLCPHPNDILKKSSLKTIGWKVLISLQTELRKSD